MSITIETTKSGASNKLNSLSISGAYNHVSLHARYTVGERSKRVSLTLGKAEAIETCAAMLATLSDGDREKAMTDAGKRGDSVLRYPTFKVFASKTRENYLESQGREISTPVINRKPALFQKLKAPMDTNGNSRSLYVLYCLDGNTHSVFKDEYGNTPRACKGLIQLDSVTITALEYKEWVKPAPSIGIGY